MSLALKEDNKCRSSNNSPTQKSENKRKRKTTFQIQFVCDTSMFILHAFIAGNKTWTQINVSCSFVINSLMGEEKLHKKRRLNEGRLIEIQMKVQFFNSLTLSMCTLEFLRGIKISFYCLEIV